MNPGSTSMNRDIVLDIAGLTRSNPQREPPLTQFWGELIGGGLPLYSESCRPSFIAQIAFAKI
jgi:hypothetical protein